MEIWVFIASPAMGLLTFALCEAYRRFVGSGRIERNHLKWLVRLRPTIYRLIDAHFDVAMAQKDLDKLIGDMPTEFEHPVFVASRIGFEVERAVAVEAERLGLLKPKLGRPVAIVESVVDQPAAGPQQAPVEPTILVSLPLGLRDEWRDGKLVPRRAN